MALSNRIPSLDGFRAISILLVIGSHLAAQDSVPIGIRKILAQVCFGDLGVRIFFVISGFLITYLLLKEREKTHDINLRFFYLRRSLRIFPVFYTYLFVLLLINASTVLDISQMTIFSAALYIQNFAPFGEDWFTVHSWTLAVEEQFYIFWPLIFIRIEKISASAWLSLIALGSIMRSFHYKFPEIADYFLAPFFMHADFLFSGCFVAYVFFYKPNLLFRIMNLAQPLLVYCSLIAIWVFSKFEFHAEYDIFFIPTSGLVINCCICFLLVYFILKKESVGYRILNFRVVTSIGVLSYSLYIWQQFFTAKLDVWWAKYPQNILLIFMAAYTSFNLIEKPFLRLKGRFKPYIQYEQKR